MKLTLLALLGTLILTPLFSQPNTEIYLFRLELDNGEGQLSEPLNISQNHGYDNQPSFLPDGSAILFSSDRGGQTEVIRYDIKDSNREQLTHSDGSEYSPSPMLDGRSFSTIILEKDGTQLLQKYPLDGGSPEILVPDLKIGYHCWLDESRIASFVLTEPFTLQLSDLDTEENQVLDQNPGRSLHLIPEDGRLSYVSKADSNHWQVLALDLQSGEKEVLVAALPDAEDMYWTPGGQLLMGSGNQIYAWQPGQKGWKPWASLEDFGLGGITRLVVSPDGSWLAIVVSGE